jgi:hypothetical protein
VEGVAVEKMTAYAELKQFRGNCWYSIYIDSDRLKEWQGPYRDKTDAENAAHEEAKRRGYDLEWRE